MSAEPSGLADLPLLVWLSPAFPVGGFAYSHGLESAVDAGLIKDAATLKDWIDDLLACGSIRQDAIVLVAAWKAARSGDRPALVEVNDLALALCPSRERRLEAAAMGNAFASTHRATWPGAVPRRLDREDVAYPVAVGMASAAEGIDATMTVAAFGLTFVANLVSAAVRLGPIGQTDGQRVMASLMAPVRAVAEAAAMSTLDDLGGCAFRSDLASMHHETQYSRLFRS